LNLCPPDLSLQIARITGVSHWCPGFNPQYENKVKKKRRRRRREGEGEEEEEEEDKEGEEEEEEEDLFSSQFWRLKIAGGGE
jgi:hypothetical protein